MFYKSCLFILLSYCLGVSVEASDLQEVDLAEPVRPVLSMVSPGIIPPSAIPIVIEIKTQTPPPVQRHGLQHGTSVKELDQGLQNLYQDVAGYEDDCLRCSIGCWRLSGNSAQSLSIFTSLGAAFLAGIAVVPDLLDETTQTTLIVASACASLSSAVFLGIKQYSKEAISERRAQLKVVLADHGIHIAPEADESAAP